MKKLLSLIYILMFSVAAFAAVGSTYAISPEAINIGGGTAEGTTLKMFGAVMPYKPEIMAGSTLSIESRFMSMISSTVEQVDTWETPVVYTIAPNAGVNNLFYYVTIEGYNISNDAVVRLERTGYSPINGTGISRGSIPTSIECTLSLTGEAAGRWDVVIENVGWGKFGRLSQGFTITSLGPVRIMGTPSNEPNPFNPNEGPTHITYKLSANATITHFLFNQRGELVWQKTFPAGSNGGRAGDNEVTWDADSDFRESVPTGVYVDMIVAKSGGTKELGRIRIAVIRRK